jgi:hypothetical protein
MILYQIREYKKTQAPPGLLIKVSRSKFCPGLEVFLNFHMSSAALQLANPKADVARRGQALAHNINAALGLQEVLKTNLGPKGTLKM